jgi:hypothetical protein
LILALDEFFHFDVFQDAELGEVLLEDLKVADVLVIVFGLEIDLTQLDFAWIKQIKHLTVMGACAQLLNFGDAGVEKIIDPGEKVTSREFNSIVGVEADLIDHYDETFEDFLLVG